jgi:hypothetical protein
VRFFDAIVNATIRQKLPYYFSVDATVNDYNDWLNKNCTGKWAAAFDETMIIDESTQQKRHMIDKVPHAILITDESDATLFALRWSN